MWNATGSKTWDPPANITNTSIVVQGAGGGGGRRPGSGGGGAGGFNYSFNITIIGRQTVVVGAGGAVSGTSDIPGTSGGNSIFGNVTSNITSNGGSGGGSRNTTPDNFISYEGASTGGGGSPAVAGIGTSNISNQEGYGRMGGTGQYTNSTNYNGGGGGSFLSNGTDASISLKAGDGGQAINVTITGENITLAGGGGGGTYSTNISLAGTGGSNGTVVGGRGGYRTTAGSAAAPSTGSGGAGGGSTGAGTAGAGGVIYLKFNAPPTSTFTTGVATGTGNARTASFNSTAKYNILSYIWNATNVTGDNVQFTFCTTQNATYKFPSGNYTINLTVINYDGVTVSTQNTWVNLSTPPVMNITSNRTGGSAPVTIMFNDTTTGLKSDLPTVWSWFFGDEPYNQSFVPQTVAAGWGIRTQHASVILPDSSIVLMGGTDNLGLYYNDTWRSTNKGVAWTRRSATAGWISRAGFGSTATLDGSIVLTGGYDTDGVYNDTWISKDAGTTWVRQNISSGWSTRQGHSFITLKDGSIVLTGGYDNTVSTTYNDTWRSIDDGVTWELMNASSGWSKRYGSSVAALPNDTIVIIGGSDDSSYLSDVWRSKDKGSTWAKVSDNNFGDFGKYGHSTVVMQDKSMVMMGGNSVDSLNNQVWRSTNEGLTWVLINASADWSGRFFHTSVVIPDGSIILMGGTELPSGLSLNDTWRFSPQGSNTKNISHRYNDVGRFSVSLTGSTSTSYNTTTYDNYIYVGLPIAQFVTTTHYGNAPLTVGFTDKTKNVSTSWLWDFGDGNTSTLQNPVYTYNASGIYNVSLTTTSPAGTNITIRRNFVNTLFTPVSNLTSNTTSGASPFAVQFNDTSTGNPNYRSWLFGDEDYNGTWVRQSATSGWTTREYQNIVALPDDSVVLIGGDPTENFGAYLNDTWITQNKGVTWTRQSANADWIARLSPGTISTPDGDIILFGGYSTDSSPTNDTWISQDRGITWTQQTANAGWDARSEQLGVSLSNGTLVIYGGSDNFGYVNDVWSSTDKGVTWTLTNASIGEDIVHLSSLLALPNDDLLLIGGKVGLEYLNSTWISKDAGVTWTLQNQSVEWPPRHSPQTASLPNGDILLYGGISEDYNNETWISKDEGITWFNNTIVGSPALEHRSESKLVALHDGSILLIGIYLSYANEYVNDTWRLAPQGSTLQNPVHTYTSPGTYSVSLTTNNSLGRENTITKLDYINVTPAPLPPVASFTTNPSSGTIPLTVIFNDTSINTPTSWNWSFGDGYLSTTKNTTHVFSTGGNYTVNLTVTNDGGSNSTTKNITTGSLITANFTSNTTTGLSPLSVQFTDTSTGSPDGWEWYFGDEPFTGNWVEQNSSMLGGETNRYKFGSTTLPDDSVIVTGGVSDSYFNNTLRSTDQGVTWVEQSANAGWVARYDIATTSLSNGNIIMMGGFTPENEGLNDTWRSTDQGVTWELMNASSGWDARGDLKSISLPDNSIVLTQGSNNEGGVYNDVWRSTDEGTTWIEQTSNAELPPRQGASLVTLHDGSILLIGGVYGGDIYNDTWRSTDQGVTWTEQSSSAGWVGRFGHTSEVLVDNSIILMGGVDNDGTDYNDMWRSTDKGVTWVQLQDATWDPRTYSESTVTANGKILVIEGLLLGGGTAGIWIYTPNSGSIEQNPSHIYTVPGTYSVTLIANNAVSYNAITKLNYITTAEIPVVSFTASNITGTTTVIVNFTDTSSNTPTGWTWNATNITGNNTPFTFSSAQNPTYTFGVGNFSITLNASNSAGSNISSQTTFINVSQILPPVSDFTTNVSSGLFSLNVEFNDTSTNTPTSWNWSFGDGYLSTTKNTTHAYSTGGNYTVNLTVTNDDGSSSKIKYVTVYNSTASSFTVNSTGGITPQAILFTDTSSNTTEWNWSFRNVTGNNTEVWFSQLQSPTHTFGIGNFSITLNASNSWDTNISSQTTFINVSAPPATPPVSDFTMNVSYGLFLLNVEFNDTSTGNPASWNWSFGDGYLSTEQNTTHIYSTGGNYTVNLTVTNAGGSSSKIKYVTVYNSTTSSFTVNSTGGITPQAILFTDTSSNTTEWNWSFRNVTGNNTEVWFSQLQNPTYTFRIGNFSITLNASNSAGSNISSQITFINVSEVPVTPPTADFTSNVSSGLFNLPVEFNDTSTGSPVSWNWSFGDGYLSTSQNTTHIYSTGGNYTVNLTATNAGGSSSKIKYVAVYNSTTSSFSGTPTSGSVPLSVQFTGVAGNGTTYLWIFGDGNTTSNTQLSPEHYYTGVGNYSVNFSVSNGLYINWTNKSGYINASTGVVTPVASFTASNSTGTTTVIANFTDTSSNTPTGWTWNATNVTGNNTPFTFSSAQNPTYTFGVGNFSITLNASNSAGSNISSQTTFINVSEVPVTPPTADITMNVSSGLFSLNVGLNDTSSNTPTSWNWSFGDGYLATSQNTTHIYSTGGNYTVNLTATNAGGSSSKIKYVTVYNRTTSAFSGTPVSGTVPFNVAFTGVAGNGTTYLWIFGDGNTTSNNVLSPEHYYTGVGTYSVNFSVSNGQSTNWTNKSNYITVNSGAIAPVASFTASNSTGTNTGIVNFTDTSSNTPNEWSWNATNVTGNNTPFTFSSSQYPTYTFGAGNFSIKLNASNTAGYNISSQTTFINISLNLSITSDFTANVTSGAVPMAVQFTDTTLGSPNSWAWFFGDETYNQSWVEQNASSGWGARYGHSSVVMSDGSIILMGGQAGSNVKNDTWRSTDNGASWTRLTANAEWDARTNFAAVALPDGSIVLMGGHFSSGYKNDVWRSTNGGITWTQQTEHAGGTNSMSYCAMVSLSDSTIIMVGGGSPSWDPDVWRSTNKGANWTLLSPAAWGARYGMSAVVMPDDSIVMMGGFNGYSNWWNDTWRSTDKGTTWVSQSSSAGWVGRYGHTSVVMPDGSIVLMGGYGDGIEHQNDVWRSTDMGVTWELLDHSFGGVSRYYHQSVVTKDGSIILTGGQNSAYNPLNDTWRLAPQGSNIQNPVHTYTNTGLYSVSLTASSSTSVDKEFKLNYINVTGVPPFVADFTSNATSGTFPRSIQFNDTTTSSPTAWDWNFGDGTAHSTERNPVHTYNAAGTYTVIMTASKTGSSDTITKLNYIYITTPTISFTSNITGGIFPTSIQFNDTSVGLTPTAWYWTFGDGTPTSNEQNPVHTYTRNGTFTVSLNIISDSIRYLEIKTNYITITDATPSVQFLAVPVEGLQPLTVQFYDQSTNTPTSWDWNFGDGTAHSFERNPIHIYSNENVYTVILTATNGYGSTSKTKINYIEVTSPEGNIMTNPVVINTTTNCVSFYGYKNGTTSSTVWFEYGMVQDYTNGYKSFKTKNQTGIRGNFTYTQCGIPILPGESYKVHAGGVIAGRYVYGMNRTFTLPESMPHVTTTYEVQVDKFVQDGLDPVSLLTYDVWQPYLGLMGGLFFAILMAFIFMNIAIKQKTISLTIITLLLTGVAVWRLLPPSFIKIAQMLFIAGIAGLLYWLFVKRR